MAERSIVYGKFNGFNDIVSEAKKLFSMNDQNRKHGTNSSCVVVEYCGEKYAVLKTSNMIIYENKPAFNIDNTKEMLVNGKLQFSNVVKLTQKHKVNSAVPIIGYVYDDENFSQFDGSAYAKGYIIQECAKGEELYGSVPRKYRLDEDGLKILLQYTEKYANAPYKQFLDYVNNFREICRDLKIDPSKRNNFFYDEEEGFSFIDLNFEGKDKGSSYIVSWILGQFRPFQLNSDCTQSSRKKYMELQNVLIEKLKRALLESKFDKQTVEQEISKQQTMFVNLCMESGLSLM